MTQKPKDDFCKDEIEILRIYFPLTYNALRQQTAQDIFKEIDTLSFDTSLDLRRYAKIKQKYLGGKY